MLKEFVHCVIVKLNKYGFAERGEHEYFDDFILLFCGALFLCKNEGGKSIWQNM